MATISTNTYVTNFNADGQATGVELMTNEKGHMYPISHLFSGNTLDTSLRVTPPSSAGMAVTISAGYVQIPSVDKSYAYLSWLEGDAQLSIDAADASSARWSVIVAYIDRAIQYSRSQSNNPGLMKITEVKGNATTVPGDAAIKTAVGANNPFVVLANVYVPANATSVAASNITDRRTGISLSHGVELPKDSYASGVTPGAGSSFANNIQISVINAGATVPTSSGSDILVCRISQ